MLVLVGAVVLGVQVLAARAAEPSGPPPQDVPGPVLLVPGYGGNGAAPATPAERMPATGRGTRVLELPGDGTGDLGAQVRVPDAVVDDAPAAGAPSVDVVGYSAGGVVIGLWIAREDGANKARRVVTLGSPLNGTQLAGAGATALPDACPPACRQIAPAARRPSPRPACTVPPPRRAGGSTAPRSSPPR